MVRKAPLPGGFFMRKILAFGTLAALLTLPCIALTACKSGGARCRYEIEAEYFAEGRLVGSMTVTVPNNTENVLEEIPFALYGNAFAEGVKTPPVSDLFASACYYAGESFGGMTVGEVKGAKSFEVTGEDRSILSVTLSEPLYPDESVALSIGYTLTLAKANHRLGIGEHCVSLSYFYPMLPAQGESGFFGYVPAQYGEPFVSDCADFSIALTVPAGIAVACGGSAEQREENGKTVVRYSAENVRDAAFVLGDFKRIEAERDGVQIDYYYFADETPDATLKTACDSVATYSELFGAYPYPRYALAESDLYFGGMEYSGFATVSCALRREERAAVVAHETAHQWWYASVGSNQAECAFMDEGLSEYSVALFFENNPGYGVGYRDFIALSEHAYRNYYSVQSQLSDGVNTGMVRPLGDYSGDYEYRVIAYDKGVVLFDRLREEMGDGRFFSALKAYAKRYAGKVATQYDLTACFSSWEELVRSFTEGKCVI